MSLRLSGILSKYVASPLAALSRLPKDGVDNEAGHALEEPRPALRAAFPFGRRHKLRRKETLIFTSRDIPLLTEISRWFTSHTGFGVSAVSVASGRALTLPDLASPTEDGVHGGKENSATTGPDGHYLVELQAGSDPAGEPGPDLSDGPRLRVPLGRDWPLDVKGFAVLAAVRAELGLSPQVSVVVPNFNHGAYLRKRLHSVYAQGFKDFEVILLDDASSDGSRTILDRYARLFPWVTVRAYNQSNSGNSFAQWGKGIGLATASLIWIAESDDFAELDLLEALLPFFEDENVRLAYCYPMFVDGSGVPQPSATEHYFRQASPDRWNSPYVETSHNEVNQVLGAVNTIPNVSSAVFRRPGDAAVLEEAAAYRLCGDWYFYLELIRGWKVAFTNETRSYFRFQDTGVTGTTLKSSNYFEEHLALAGALAEKYRLSEDVLRRYFEQLRSVLRTTGAAEDLERLPRDIDTDMSLRQRTYLNVLLVTQGFFLGGGEIFPVHLANELRRQGHNVLILSLDVFPETPRIRSAISPEIPVFRTEGRIGSQEAFGRFLRDNGIDVINSHGHGSDLFVLKFIGGEAVPWLVTMHGGYEFLLSEENSKARPDEYRHVRQCLDRQLDRVDKWIYIAEKNLEPFGNRPDSDRDRFVKIANGLKNPDRRGVSRSELGIPQDAFVLCCATRAIPEKGWHHAIELTERVAAQVDREVHLILLGEGPVLDELRSRPPVPRVHPLGFRDEVVDYFALSDLGVLCSSYSGESFPLCIIECLFAGRPVLATDIGECRDMLSAGGRSTAGAVIPLEGGRVTEATLSQMERWLAGVIRDVGEYGRLCNLAEQRSKTFHIETITTRYVDTYRKEIEAKTIYRRRRDINMYI